MGLAEGESIIKGPSPLNAVKDTYDHGCYCACSDEHQHLMTDSPTARRDNPAAVVLWYGGDEYEGIGANYTFGAGALKVDRRQDVGPTSAFYSCIPTGMPGLTWIFWANLTSVVLKDGDGDTIEWRPAADTPVTAAAGGEPGLVSTPLGGFVQASAGLKISEGGAVVSARHAMGTASHGP